MDWAFIQQNSQYFTESKLGRVFGALISANGGVVADRYLLARAFGADAINMSRQSISDYISRIREAGYNVIRVSDYGYRIPSLGEGRILPVWPRSTRTSNVRRRTVLREIGAKS